MINDYNNSIGLLNELIYNKWMYRYILNNIINLINIYKIINQNI